MRRSTKTRPAGGTILVHIDRSGRWHQSLQHGIELARSRRATLVLAAIRRNPPRMVGGDGMLCLPGSLLAPEFERDEEVQAHRRTAAALALVPREIVCRAVSLSGPVTSTLVKQARTGRYDVVLTASPSPYLFGSRLLLSAARLLAFGPRLEVVPPAPAIPQQAA